MLLVCPVVAITDSLGRIEIPIFADGVLSGPNEDRTRRWDGLDTDIRRQMSRREEREPAGDVLFAEFKGFSREQNKRIKDSAPGELLVVEGVVEMARADGKIGRAHV